MTFGFIGAGNMGSAIAKAVAKKMTGESFYVSDANMQKAQELADIIGAAAKDNKAIAEGCDCIFIGVKPQAAKELFDEIGDILKDRKKDVVLVSMMAGVTTDKICELLGFEMPVVRIMPNIPVGVGSGIILYCSNELAKDKASFVADSLSDGGLVDELDESLIDIGTVVGGCAPAFVAMFTESLADGAVSCGLSRQKAEKYAAKVIEGTAKLLLETGKHPAKLKDEVCSPGGSTIKGVEALEKNNFRGAVISAVNSAYDKTKKLGK